MNKFIEAKQVRPVGANNYSPQPDASEWEREIEGLAYRLYKLNNQEIKIIKKE